MRTGVTTIFFNAKSQRRSDAKKKLGDRIQVGRVTPCALSFNTSTQRRAED